MKTRTCYNQNGFFKSMMLLILFLGACQRNSTNYELIHPAHIEHIENSEFSKLELTDRAMERIGIETSELMEESVTESEPKSMKVVPYGALIYGPHGEIWVYTNPVNNVFIRHEVKVNHIAGDKSYLTEGPPIGAKVVTRGAAELYGTEYQVGH